MDIWGRQKKHMRHKGTKGKTGSSASLSSATVSATAATDSTAATDPSKNTSKISELAGITLIVHVSHCTFPISCGDGRQTIKWLAIAAARRYSASVPSGRIRHRECYHSGRRPRPDNRGRPNSPSFLPLDHEAARNMPRYPQFGVTDHSTGRVVRRIDGVGGMYRTGLLAPIRVTSPKRKHRRRAANISNEQEKDQRDRGASTNQHTNEEEDNEEEEFWDAIQLTYDYARLEHPPDVQFRIENQNKLVLQSQEDLRRQKLLGNFDVSEVPSWRNQAAAAAATNPRPNTVYKLRELENDPSAKRNRSKKLVMQQQQLRSKLPRRSMFASIPRQDLALLRPTTTISVTRPLFGGQSPATPLRNWMGPRLSVPAHFNTPSDLFDFVDDDENDRIKPNDLIRNQFVDGDHVWIDLDMQGSGKASTFADMAFRRKKKKTIKIAVKKIEKKQQQIEVVQVEKRRLLVTKRDLRMDTHASESNKKVLNRLLEENISKSKMTRVIKDEVEMIQTKKFMFERYLVLENTFRHFSFLAPGDNFSLSSNEWTAMCNTCNILKSEPNINAATASRVFIASNVNLSARSKDVKDKQAVPFDEDNPKNALIMYEFLEALVRLALEKYSSLAHLRPSQKFKKLLDDHIIPVGQKITDGWGQTLARVEEDDVQDALENGLEVLQFAFVFYASLHPKMHKGKAIGHSSTHLVMNEWLHALEASGILAVSKKASTASPSKKEQISSSLTMQRAQECFVAANSHSERLKRKNSSEKEERSFRQMEFLEFLEALVHVASRLGAGESSLAENIAYVADKFKEEVHKKSNHGAYQRAKTLMKQVDFGLDDL